MKGSPIQAHRFSQRDSLVGLYFEVSAFLELVSIFVPAKRRTGIPRRLALQVKLVPFDQRLASHQPELRSRSWTERERKETVRATSHQAGLCPWPCTLRRNEWKSTSSAWCQGQRSQAKGLLPSRLESILISSQVRFSFMVCLDSDVLQRFTLFSVALLGY